MSNKHDDAVHKDETKPHRQLENDRLVKEAKSAPGEPPNRDEDEFTGKGHKAPDVDTEAEKEADNASDDG